MLKGKEESKLMIEKQNARHDWFGEVAEALICYLFSKAGFEVYGANKWGADCVIAKDRKLWRVEVKGSDSRRSNYSGNKAKKKAEVLAKIYPKDGKLIIRLRNLNPINKDNLTLELFFSPDGIDEKELTVFCNNSRPYGLISM